MKRPLLISAHIALLIACGGPDDGGTNGDGPTRDGGSIDATPAPDLAPAPDLTPRADPCQYANLGDGLYCGNNLMRMGDPDTLYRCKDKQTAQAIPCMNGCFEAPAGTPDSCKSAPGSVPDGKGIWIWTFSGIGLTATQAAQMAASWGVGFVLIKSGEDESTYTTNFSAANVAAFTSRGIEVYGWPYVRPGNTAAKADAIAQQARVPGVKGIILDVETEFNGQGAAATALCRAIRQKVNGVFLGYTTFGWVDLHLNFPFAEFDAACGDAFLPQIYWDLGWNCGGPSCLRVGVSDYQKHGWKAPVWPIQDNYAMEYQRPTPSVADLNKFFDAGGPRSSLWRWPNDEHTTLLRQLPQLHWKNN